MAQLVHADPDGDDTGGLPPSTLGLQTTAEGIVVLEELGDGKVKVTAHDEVGAVAVSATVPHAPRTVPLMVTVADLAPAAHAVEDHVVVWPQPGRDEATSLADPTLPFQSDSGVGPWTWAELEAIVAQPAADAAGAPEGRRPLVVRGSSFAVGDLVVGTGDTTVLGEVTAIDTAVVDGEALQLLTVELRSPALLFEDVEVHLTTADLAAIGVVPSFAMPDVVTAPAEPGVTDEQRHRGAYRTIDGPIANGDGDDDEPADPAVGECKADVTGTIAEVKHTIVPSIDPVFDADLAITGDGTLFGSNVMLQLRAGIQGKVTGGIEAKAMFNVTGSLKCGLVDIATFNLPAPPPLGAFLTIESTPRIFGTFELAAQGGPSYTYKSTCETAFTAIVGFRYNTLGAETYKDLSDFDRKTDCSSGGKFDSSINGFGAPSVSGSATLGVLASGPADLRIGGTLTRKMAEFFDEPNLGLMKMIALEVQPKAKMAWANTAYVVGNKETPALAQIDIGIKGLLQAEPVQWVIKKMRTTVAVEPAIFEMEIPIAQAFRGINAAGSPKLEVGGEAITNGVKVGDRLDLTAETGTGTKRAPFSTDFDVDEVKAYAKDDDGSFQEIDGFALDDVTQPAEADADKGPTITGHLPITEDVCEQVGTKDRDVVVLTTGEMLTLDTRGIAAAFTLRCAEPELAWVPDEVRFTPPATEEAAGRTQTVRLQVSDAPDSAEPWTYSIDESADWLTVEGSSGNTMRPRLVEVDGATREGVADDVKLTIDCDALGDDAKTATVTATIETPDLPDELTDLLEVTGDCRDLWTTVSPTSLTEPGGTLTIAHSDGQEGVAWSVGGGGARYTPSSGTFPDGEGSVTVKVEFANPEPSCPGTTPGKVTTGSLSSTNADDQTFHLIYLEKSTSPPCDPPPPPCTTDCGGPAGASGDPHLTTLDGLHYDAQVLGEYEYLVPDPIDPAANGPVLHARHQLYSLRATTIEAAALGYHDHRIEVYGNPWKVIVDGEERTDDILEQFGSDLTVTSTPWGIQVTADGASYLFRRAPAWLDLSVQTRPNAPLTGLLGSPNGIAADDLRLRDGSDTITEHQARIHGDGLYRLTESWRVTDLSQSLFTIASPSFDSTVRPLDWSTVEPYIAQIQAMFASLEPVCGGLDDTNSSDYRVRMLALELAAGSSIDDAATMTCRYNVIGGVRATDDDFTPSLVGGSTIEVTAPGFTPCTTVAAVTGYYACTMVPDLEALARGDVADGAPTFHLVATPPGTGNTIEVDAPATGKAALGATRSVTRNLEVSIDGNSSLRLTGELTRGSIPLDLPVTLQVDEHDGSGTLVRTGLRTVTADQTSGAYELRRMFDPSTRKIVVTAKVQGSSESLTRTLDVPGTGQVELDFDVDYNPTVITLSGRFEGAPSGSMRLVSYREGVQVRNDTLTMTAVDGRYSLTKALPLGVDRVVATAMVGAFATDFPTATFEGLTPGTVAGTFDVVLQPVTVTVSGTLHVDGNPPTGPVPIVVTGTDPSGTQTLRTGANVVADPVTGAYSVEVALPNATRSVTAVAQVGASSSTWATATKAVTPGANTVSLSVGIVRNTVTIDGRLLVDANPPSSPVPLVFTMFDPNGLEVGTETRTVTPGSDGRFALSPDLVLPIGTAELRVQAQFPGPSVDWRSASYPLAAGHTDVSIDLSVTHRAVTVDGIASSWGTPSAPTTIEAVWIVYGIPVLTEDLDVAPGPEGRFHLDLLAPTSATDVVLERFGAGGSGTDWFSLDADGPTAIVDWDLRPAQLSLSGTRTVDGAPTGPASLTGDLVALSDGVAFDHSPGLPIAVDASGAYHLGLTVPEVGRDPGDEHLTWRMDVTLTNGEIWEIDLGNLPRGVTTRTAEIDDSPTTNLSTEIEVHAWIAPGAEGFLVTPIVWSTGAETWEELDRVALEVERLDGPSGTRAILRADIPIEATWFRIDSFGGVSRAFPVDDDHEVTVVEDVSFQQGTVMVPVSGTLRGGRPWCPSGETLVFQVEVLSFVGGDDGTVNTLLDTFTVFPEADGTFDVALPVVKQPGVRGYRFHFFAHPDYSPFTIAWDAWHSYDASQLETLSIEIDDSGYCAI